MNEKIRELSEKAGFYTVSETFADELPEEMKNDSGQWVIKEWEVE